MKAPGQVPNSDTGSPSTFPCLTFPSWEVGLEMSTSAHGALRPQVYRQVSDSHEVFISSSFGVNLEYSRARSRHGTEVSMHAQLTWPR